MIDIDQDGKEFSLILANTDLERDLEVIVNNKLKWDDHINAITLRANIILGKLRKIFHKWEPNTFRILYKTYVRPILEYASSAWYALKKISYKTTGKCPKTSNKMCTSSKKQTI